MNATLPRLAAALLTGAAALVPFAPAPAAADKPASAAPPTAPLPAPEWLKFIDQGDRDPRLKGYKTPEGVKVEIVAQDPVVIHPAALAFAEDGTPYVVEWRHVLNSSPDRKDVVLALSDAADKGVYDTSRVVFEGDGIRGILPYDGRLYVCGGDAVRRYKRGKDDGPFDVGEVVAQGFSDVCGVALGPDGRLYLSAHAGDNNVKGSDGGQAVALRTGGVFRCLPDGSKLETYAIGFLNPAGPLSFDAAGNPFLADDGNHAEDGGAFAQARLLHVPEAADFGYRGAARPPAMDPIRAAASGESPGKMAPMLQFGRGDAHGLLLYNDSRFPDNYRGLILAPEAPQFPGVVHAYKVERQGGTFEAVEEFEMLKSDDRAFCPVQAVVGPDGAVYVVDYRSDPKDGDHGRILRLTWAGVKDQPALPPLAMDSWAKIAALGDDDLVNTLAGDEASCRERARRELAKRGEKERPALLKLFKDAAQPDAARAAALGALESMWDADAQAAALLVLEKDVSPDLRRLAADAVGLSAAKGDGDVHVVLLRGLNDVAPDVKRSVALAMSRVAADGAPDNLVNTWAFDDGRDPCLRDGLVRAIENLGQPGVDRLIALGESGVEKDWDKMVQAFTMMRTRPAAEAIPRVLGNPHLSAPQRAALMRSYENYLLDPPLSAAPAADYLVSHPDEDPTVKRAGMEALASMDVGPEDARRVGRAFLDKKLPPETKPQAVQVLGRNAQKDADCAWLLKAIGGQD